MEEQNMFHLAWVDKRVTEADWDLGHKDSEEELRYADTTRNLYDSPGFKALPVSVQKEIKAFLALEPTAPRRFGPSIVLHYKVNRDALRAKYSQCVPVVPMHKA
jgi:hypothetical protein